MQLGMVGLGRMGANIVRRLMRDGHDCAVYNRDDIRRAQGLSERGLDSIDCGTSGGVFGLERGYCLMIGGPDGSVERLEPIFATVAPGVESAERTPGRTGEPDTAENG